MKKIAVIMLCAATLFTMAACRKMNEEPTNASTETTTPITVPTLPDMTMPSTNIPDPTVDSHSTENTMGTEEATEETNP